jgi:hypothetical protein
MLSFLQLLKLDALSGFVIGLNVGCLLEDDVALQLASRVKRVKRIFDERRRKQNSWMWLKRSTL